VLPWLTYEKKVWMLNFEVLRQGFAKEKIEKHWRGKMQVEPEVEELKTSDTSSTLVHLFISQEDAKVQTRSKIFLSHKGEDKKMVRRFLRALEVIGYEVWLDENNLRAGDHLERGIRRGFEESSAAIFFITENFKDERYLKAEIDYAIEQKRLWEDEFRIITLAFRKGSARVEIPPMLKNYVWKNPSTELDALIEIVKALR